MNNTGLIFVISDSREFTPYSKQDMLSSE